MSAHITRSPQYYPSTVVASAGAGADALRASAHPSRLMALDPYLSKESLSVLATIGFGKREPRHGPHKHHGIAARTRLSIAGKVRADILHSGQLIEKLRKHAALLHANEDMTHQYQ